MFRRSGGAQSDSEALRANYCTIRPDSRLPDQIRQDGQRREKGEKPAAARIHWDAKARPNSLPAMKGSERAATGIWKGACRHYSISNTNTGNVCRRIHNAKFENLFRGLDEKPGRRRGGK